MLARSQPEKFGNLAAPVVSKDSPFYHSIGKELEGRLFPQAVADEITRFFDVTRRPLELKGVMGLADKAYGMWKSQALLSPAYVIRNVFQNLFGGLMAGANPVAVQARAASPDIRRIVREFETKGAVSGTVTIAGERIPAQQLFDMARKENLLNSSMVAMFALPTEARARIAAAWQKGYGAIHRINNRFENDYRLATFAHFLDKGQDARTAAINTLRAMPDLTDITRFEREGMARLFPWYRWVRRNGSLQLFHYLPNKPAWFAGQEKLRRNLETALVEDPMPDDTRPSWMREAGAVQISGDKKQGNSFLLASWLPFEQLNKLFAAGADISQPAKMALEQLNPALKFPVELGTGRDIMKDRPLRAVSAPEAFMLAPKAILGQSGTALDNAASIRPLREMRRMSEMPSVGTAVQRAFLGGSFQPLLASRGLAEKYTLLKEQAMKLRAKIARAKRLNDRAEVAELSRQWVTVMAQLRKYGLPGVSKATNAVLEKRGVPQGEPAFAK
jgi:hypothetical protein